MLKWYHLFDFIYLFIFFIIFLVILRWSEMSLRFYYDFLLLFSVFCELMTVIFFLQIEEKGGNYAFYQFFISFSVCFVCFVVWKKAAYFCLSYSVSFVLVQIFKSPERNFMKTSPFHHPPKMKKERWRFSLTFVSFHFITFDYFTI